MGMLQFPHFYIQCYLKWKDSCTVVINITKQLCFRRGETSNNSGPGARIYSFKYIYIPSISAETDILGTGKLKWSSTKQPSYERCFFHKKSSLAVCTTTWVEFKKLLLQNGKPIFFCERLFGLKFSKLVTALRNTEPAEEQQDCVCLTSAGRRMAADLRVVTLCLQDTSSNSSTCITGANSSSRPALHYFLWVYMQQSHSWCLCILILFFDIHTMLLLCPL